MPRKRRDDVQKIIDNDLPAAVAAYHAHERGEPVGTVEAQAQHDAAGLEELRDPEQRKKWHPSRDPAADIVKLLHKVSAISGHRHDTVLDHWLTIVLATQMGLPLQMLYARTHGAKMPFEEEPAELQEMWLRVMRQYDTDKWPRVYHLFAEAWSIMQLDAQFGYNDYLGMVYQTTESNSKWLAQYFTPWAVGVMIARMTCGEGGMERLVAEHMGEAIDSWPGAERYRVLGMQWGVDHPETTRYIFEQHLTELWPFYDPPRVIEPCSGSGVLLLTAMQETADWIVQGKYIEFFGIDIDPICVLMTKIQVVGLYGANGYALLAAAPAMLPEEQLPTPEQLFHRVKEAFSYTQCGNSLSHELARYPDGMWTLVHWTETPHGKAHLAQREQENVMDAEKKHQLQAEARAAAAAMRAAKKPAPPPKPQTLDLFAVADVDLSGGQAADLIQPSDGETRPAANRKANGVSRGQKTEAWQAMVKAAKSTKGASGTVDQEQLDQAIATMATALNGDATQEELF